MTEKGKLIFFALIWGASLPLNIGLLNTLGPGFFLMPTFMAAYLALNLRYHRQLKQISFAEVGRGLILGVLIFAMARTLIVEARAANDPTALAGIALAVVLVPLLQFFSPSARPTPRQLVAALAAGAGTIILCGRPDPAGLLAAATLAIFITRGTSFARRNNARNMVIIALAAATFLSLISMGRDLPGNIPLTAWLLMGVNAVINCGFGLAALGRCLEKFPPPTTAVMLTSQAIAIQFTRPDFAVPGKTEMVGFFLICAGIILCLPQVKNPIDKASN